MTAPLRSTTNPTPMMMAEQVARHWSRSTAWEGGFTLLDRDRTNSTCNLFTRPMPLKTNRMHPAATITIGPSTIAAPNEATQHVGLTITVAGETQDQVLALLQDFIDTVAKPGGKPFCYVPRVHGGTFQLDGVIGAPPVEHFDGRETLGVYRVRRLDLVSPPQIINPIAGEGGNDDGDVVGELSVQAVGTPDVMPAPIEAFSLEILEGVGSVQLRDGELVLTRIGHDTITIDLTAPDLDTIGELVEELAAGFAFTDLNEDVAARSSLDLVEIPTAVAIEDVGGTQMFYARA